MFPLAEDALGDAVDDTAPEIAKRPILRRISGKILLKLLFQLLSGLLDGVGWTLPEAGLKPANDETCLFSRLGDVLFRAGFWVLARCHCAGPSSGLGGLYLVVLFPGISIFGYKDFPPAPRARLLLN